MPIDVFVFKLLQCSVFVFVFMIEGIFAGAAALYACGCVCFLVCVFFVLLFLFEFRIVRIFAAAASLCSCGFACFLLLCSFVCFMFLFVF